VVVAGAALEDVQTRSVAAEQLVIACAAAQPIGAVPTFEPVVAVVAGEHVDACGFGRRLKERDAAVERIGAVATGQPVTAALARDHVIAAAAVDDVVLLGAEELVRGFGPLEAHPVLFLFLVMAA
jgi:hypothetical protein